MFFTKSCLLGPVFGTVSVKISLLFADVTCYINVTSMLHRCNIEYLSKIKVSYNRRRGPETLAKSCKNQNTFRNYFQNATSPINPHSM